MLMTVNELRSYITTNLSDDVLTNRLSALELMIRRVTNNNFQNRAMRCVSEIEGGVILSPSSYFLNGDTVQISENPLNDGLYVIGDGMLLDPAPYDSPRNLITKVIYPMDIKMGAVEIIKWQIRNEAQNDGSSKVVHSESISRHSVTYASDATENSIDPEMGVPYKYSAFLKPYAKARF